MNTENIILICSISANVIIAIVGLIALMVRYCYLSKCINVSLFWNCIKFNRDIVEENRSMQIIKNGSTENEKKPEEHKGQPLEFSKSLHLDV
jgi:hypothetical protein